MNTVITADVLTQRVDSDLLTGNGTADGLIASGGRLNCFGFTLRNSGSSASTFAAANNVNCVLDHVTLVRDNPNNSFHQVFVVNGANATLAACCKFQGSMAGLFSVSGAVVNSLPVPYVLLDVPNYTTATAVISDSGRFITTPGASFQGSATGKRYLLALNGTMNANGAGPNFFPRDVAGTEQTGGRYAL